MVTTRAPGERVRRIMIEFDDSIWTQLQLVENRDADGILRVTLVGELDLAVAGRLSSRLDQLRRAGTPVRLDLARLEFLDLSGVRVLMRAAQHRNPQGEQLLEIGHDITPVVRRVIDLLGVGPILWPANRPFR